MTLEEALHELGTMSVQISITAGEQRMRRGFPSDGLWEVIALTIPGECYPPFAQKDDLCAAVKSVLEQIKDRRMQGSAFVDAHPELKALPRVDDPGYLIKKTDP